METALAEWLVAVAGMTPRMLSLSASASSGRCITTDPTPSARQYPSAWQSHVLHGLGVFAAAGLGVSDFDITSHWWCFGGFRQGLETWFVTPWFHAWVEWCSGHMAMARDSALRRVHIYCLCHCNCSSVDSSLSESLHLFSCTLK